MNNCIRIGKYAILDHLFYIIVKVHEFVSMCGVGFGGFVLVFSLEGRDSLNSLSSTFRLKLSFWEVM